MDGGDQNKDRSLQQAIAALKLLGDGLDHIRLPVTGDSMTPMLKDRDILEVSFVHPSKLLRGDVIVRGRHELIIHRVVGTRDQYVYTKGDARYWIDPMRGGDDIIGKVRRIERNGLIANMETRRWAVVNRLIGFVGWVQVVPVWIEQLAGASRRGRNWLHRISYWTGKRLNWVILFLLVGGWLRKKSLRMDEKC
mgnify:CR=1 FL=1